LSAKVALAAHAATASVVPVTSVVTATMIPALLLLLRVVVFGLRNTLLPNHSFFHALIVASVRLIRVVIVNEALKSGSLVIPLVKTFRPMLAGVSGDFRSEAWAWLKSVTLFFHIEAGYAQSSSLRNFVQFGLVFERFLINLSLSRFKLIHEFSTTAPNILVVPFDSEAIVVGAYIVDPIHIRRMLTFVFPESVLISQKIL
jgi:hypothetical protein